MFTNVDSLSMPYAKIYAMTSLPPFVDVATLSSMGTTEGLDLVVCDCRSYLDERNGIDAYNSGHIPGARFLDLETNVSSEVEAGSGKGRHPLPHPDDFAASLSRAGIGHGTTVVAYDDVGGAIAARLVWMLRNLGQPAAVLDGGIAAWSGPLETESPVVESVENEPRPFRAELLATADDVAATVANGGLVADSRGPDRYAGHVEPIDPIAGHVPGAVSLPFADNLKSGALRPVDELAARFTNAGVDDDTIFYCGSGVTACHNLLAAELAGIARPRLYVGSWSGWVDQDNPPVATSES